ncbi:unnamed protein product, partial [Mesorhabditis belari]|uniref:Short neuropeptide F n=1 Tax=Mesorhabditis belari TaxID=2138241 RepID=A0AAF3J592_9BILA
MSCSVLRWLLVLLALTAFAAASLQDDYLRLLIQNQDQLEDESMRPALRARRTLMHRSSRNDGHIPLRTISNPSDLPMFRFG